MRSEASRAIEHIDNILENHSDKSAYYFQDLVPSGFVEYGFFMQRMYLHINRFFYVRFGSYDEFMAYSREFYSR